MVYQKRVITLRRICVGFGLLHAVVMSAFATGPELSPLVVLVVDAPIAYFTQHLKPQSLALGIPIVACSIIYPGIIFLGGILLLRPQSLRDHGQ